MKKLLFALMLLLGTGWAEARQRASGYVEKGGTTYIVYSNVSTSGKVQKSYPSATVTVYLTGTQTLAVLYSDDNGTLKSNPFTAASDGYWFFYADDGRYDVRFSGSGITTPWTQSDVWLLSATTGAVTSVFGRTGAVVKNVGDYNFSDIGGTANVAQLPAAGGDLSGTLSSATVTKLQGDAVSAAAPIIGGALVWNGTSYTPTPVSSDHAALSNLTFATSGHTGFVSLSGTEVLANKTLTTPTIASFVNAAHTHADAAGGGQLTDTALSAAVSAAKGGTGQTSYTIGDVPYASGATTISKLGIGAAGTLAVSTGTAPSWSSTVGAQTTFSKGIINTPYLITLASANIATDASLANHFRVTLDGNCPCTLQDPTNAVNGMRVLWELIQDATGSRTISTGSKFVAGPYTITLTVTASKRDFIEAVYNSTTDKWYIINFTKGY